MSIGIYCIRNLVNNKIYVGGSTDIESRWVDEQYVYNCNTYLGKDLKYFGIDNFEFIILEECPMEYLYKLEIKWILLLDSTNRDRGYNKNIGGGIPVSSNIIDGRKSSMFRQRLSLAHTGRKHSEETKAKIGASSKGRIHVERTKRAQLKREEELQRRLLRSAIKRHHSEETKKKISDTKKGTVVSEETRSRMSEKSKLQWRRRKLQNTS